MYLFVLPKNCTSIVVWNKSDYSFKTPIYYIKVFIFFMKFGYLAKNSLFKCLYEDTHTQKFLNMFIPCVGIISVPKLQRSRYFIFYLNWYLTVIQRE